MARRVRPLLIGSSEDGMMMAQQKTKKTKPSVLLTRQREREKEKETRERMMMTSFPDSTISLSLFLRYSSGWIEKFSVKRARRLRRLRRRWPTRAISTTTAYQTAFATVLTVSSTPPSNVSKMDANPTLIYFFSSNLKDTPPPAPFFSQSTKG